MRAFSFEEEGIIKSILDFNYSDKTDADPFNISYGIDKNFLYGCGVSIASILISNKGIDFTFHVFTDYFSDNDKEKFSELAQKYKSRIVVYLIDCEQLKLLPSTKNWTYATYFRFIIADYFFGKVDKVLYLDADIACQGGIKELVEFSFDNHEVAAVVAEGDAIWWSKRASSLATPELANGYFNAGFLLINIPAWGAVNISWRAIDMLRTPEIVARITHLDQDVLNILLAGKSRFLDKKFNTQYSINYELSGKVKNPVNEKTVFIHYIGPTKPWHAWGDYPVSTGFLNAKAHSPWVMTPLLPPSNSNQYRYCAKHLWHKNKKLSAVIFYFNYFLMKIFRR